MKLKRRKTYINLLLSHLVILCLSLGISMFTYVNTEKIAKNEVMQHYKTMLEKNQVSIDATLKSISGILYDISRNRKLEEISTYNLPLSNTQRYNMVTLGNQFYFSGFDYLIESAYVVFPRLGWVSSVFSGANNTMENFYNVKLKGQWESYSDWLGLLSKPHNMEFMVSGDGETAYFVNSISSYRGGSPTAVIFIRPKKDILFGSDSDDGMHFLIYDDTGGNNYVPVLGFGDKSPDINKMNGEDTVTIDEKQYYILVNDSAYTSWKYVYLISMSSFTKKIMSIRLWLILGIVVTCFAGITLIVVMTRRQYRPIGNTVSMLYKNFGEETEGRDEYDYIEKTVRRINDELHSQNTFAKEKGIKELGFLKLLRGETSNDELKKVVNNSLNKSHYIVGIFHIEDADRLFFDEKISEDNLELAYIIIENVYGDVFEGRFEVQKCRSNDLILIIGSDEKGDENEIYRLVCEGQNIIEREFNILFSAMMSSNLEGKKSIPLCYSEALECMAYKFFANNSVIKYSEIKNVDFGVGYYYPLEQERSLMNYLKLADFGKAKNLLFRLIDFNLAKKEISPTTFKCMIYDVCGTIIKTLSEVGEDGERFLEKLAIFRAVDKCGTVADIKKLLSELISECCQFIESRDDKSNDRVIEKIKKNVQENYAKPEFSVAMIADRFDMNANYLSTLFKQKTGTALWEYITAVRIEKAQKILSGEHVKVEKVAVMCGYENVRTFSRVFKKRTGMSPGQYRDKM